MDIIKTTNYKQFKGIIGNRAISAAHIVNLSESISRHNMLEQNPIIVNKNMEVIDGQHRLLVAERIGVPIFYTMVDKANIEDIQRLNTAAKPWQAADYLDSYIALGKTPYVNFSIFLQNHNLSIRQGLSLLKGYDDGSMYTKAFKRGLLEYTEDELKAAEDKASIREELVPFFIDTGYNRAAFFRALHTLYEKGLSHELIEKIRVAHQPLRAHTRNKDYMRDFEDIINWRKRSDIVSLA